MASRSVFRTIFFTEITQPWPTLPSITNRLSIFTTHKKISTHRTNRGRQIAIDSKSYHLARNYSSIGDTSSTSDDSEQGPPQEAVLKAISEISKADGRVGQTTNVVIGGTVTNDSTDEWLTLDQKVNSYPTVRDFTAIGTGGDDFVQAMVVAVESVLDQTIPEGQVKQKISSGGKYVSVNIGPVQVVSSEQVQAVYNAMRQDDRMKYFL